MDNYVKDLLNYRFVANTIPAVSELNKPQSISTKKSIAMKEEINLPQEVVMNKILEIRGVKVMLDRDLAELYDVKSITATGASKTEPEKVPGAFYVPVNWEKRRTTWYRKMRYLQNSTWVVHYSCVILTRACLLLNKFSEVSFVISINYY